MYETSDIFMPVTSFEVGCFGPWKASRGPPRLIECKLFRLGLTAVLAQWREVSCSGGGSPMLV